MSSYESRAAAFRSWRTWGDDAPRYLTWERDAQGCWALRMDSDRKLVGAVLPSKDPRVGPWCAMTAIRGERIAQHRLLTANDAKRWVQAQIKTGVKNVRFNTWKRAAAPLPSVTEAIRDNLSGFMSGFFAGMMEELGERMGRWTWAQWVAFIMGLGALAVLTVHFTIPA